MSPSDKTSVEGLWNLVVSLENELDNSGATPRAFKLIESMKKAIADKLADPWYRLASYLDKEYGATINFCIVKNGVTFYLSEDEEGNVERIKLPEEYQNIL
jgi:hypothetical protein